MLWTKGPDSTGNLTIRTLRSARRLERWWEASVEGAQGLLDVDRAGAVVASVSVKAFGLVGEGFFHGLVAAVPCCSSVRPLRRC